MASAFMVQTHRNLTEDAYVMRIHMQIGNYDTCLSRSRLVELRNILEYIHKIIENLQQYVKNFGSTSSLADCHVYLKLVSI